MYIQGDGKSHKIFELVELAKYVIFGPQLLSYAVHFQTVWERVTYWVVQLRRAATRTAKHVRASKL